MKFIISPAKSLDFESVLPALDYSQPHFLEHSVKVHASLVKKKPADLGALMKISDKLAQLNWVRNQNFSLPFTPENARPAAFAFNGEVYQGLDAKTLSKKEINQLQDQLLILSGLYGILRPLDLIQPYRLEMGTSLSIGKKANLYDFWKDTLTTHLNHTMGKETVLVNLASKEYFSAIDAKKLQMPVITPIFKDWKSDKLKVISFFAKKARGYMVRYMIQHNVKDPKGILGFNTGGYAYSSSETKDPSQPVFVR